MRVLEELLNYCGLVLMDEPLSCVKHKWACERFMRDIERQGTEEFPYIFIEEKAQRFYDWAGLFKHRKGVLTGHRVELAPIQKFLFGNLYGWYHMDTGLRRFNKLYWQVARKNAKSQGMSFIGSYELMAFNEAGNEANEVYCAATKSEQARIVWEETRGMLMKCEALRPYFKVAYGKITHLKSESYMRVLSDEDRRTGDGLNPQCGIIDEYHAHPTSEVYDILDSGMGARAQPLLATITTSGFDLNNPCYSVEYQLVSKILDPNVPLEMDNYMVLINELDKGEDGELVDDIKDPEVWVKANPIVCSYPEGRKYIETKLKEALEQPQKMRNFLTKQMNVWVHLTEVSYMSTARWAVCKQPVPDLCGNTCVVGVDFSSKLDLTSIAFEFPIDDKYVVLGHSFMPSETYEQKLKTDKVPYDVWVQQGWITVQNGPIVDYRKAIEWAMEKAREEGWRVAEWCLDPWCAGQIMGWLIEEGEEVVEIRQGPRTLSEPTKDFRDMVHSERVIHDGNPVIAWAVSNAIAEEVDRNKNIILNKKKSPQRIDPLASVINAHVRAMGSGIGGEPTVIVV